MRTYLPRLMLCGAMVLLASCHLVPGSDAELTHKAEEAIKAELGSTEGITFRAVRVSPDEIGRKIGMVCGEVTSPRYAGWRRFLYGRDSGLHQVEYLPADTAGQPSELAVNIGLFNSQWNENC